MGIIDQLKTATPSNEFLNRELTIVKNSINYFFDINSNPHKMHTVSLSLLYDSIDDALISCQILIDKDPTTKSETKKLENMLYGNLVETIIDLYEIDEASASISKFNGSRWKEVLNNKRFFNKVMRGRIPEGIDYYHYLFPIPESGDDYDFDAG